MDDSSHELFSLPLTPVTTHRSHHHHHQQRSQSQYNYEDNSPLESLSKTNTNNNNKNTPKRRRRKATRNIKSGATTLEYLSTLSTRIADTARRKIWESNDVYVDGAQSAVNTWSTTYSKIKSFVKQCSVSTLSVYDSTRAGAERVENRLLLPVRDYLLLPLFVTIEKAVAFVTSDELSSACQFGLVIIEEHVPFGVGKAVIAPTIRAWFIVGYAYVLIIQYPIPSQQTVTNVTTKTMDATKFAIRIVGREVLFYVNVIDVQVTRALLKSQWNIMSNGPYVNLNKGQRSSVLDHMCQRYLCLLDPIARYEFTSHVRMRNKPLYDDLIRSGLLKFRGGGFSEDDSWLDFMPEWRRAVANIDDVNVFDNRAFSKITTGNGRQCKSQIVPLWFYSPCVNGKKVKDGAWCRFSEDDRAKLEIHHLALRLEQKMDKVVWSAGGREGSRMSVDLSWLPNEPSVVQQAPEVPEAPEETTSVPPPPPLPPPPQPPARTHAGPELPPDFIPPHDVSQWYKPVEPADVFVDQGRHVVSHIRKKSRRDGSIAESILMRPVYWRFYGEGDGVRRAVWLQDSGRQQGLQPYSDRSAYVLEDAYQFLKWHMLDSSSPRFQGSGIEGLDDEYESRAVLLTVQVEGPDGEDQLVQFRSLHQIMSVKKTLTGALNPFKKRVYRGADVVVQNEDEEVARNANISNPGRNLITDMDVNMFTKDFGDETATLAATRKLAAPALFSLSFHKGADSGDDDGVEHLILVVHGIGKALTSFDLLGLVQLNSIVECCKFMRDNHSEVINQSSSFSIDSEKKGRVDFFPIEWHEKFNRSSRKNDEDTSGAGLNDIALKTIPHLRNFCNDAMLDVLYFMSPDHHDVIIDLVTTEMNLVVDKIRRYKGDGFSGKVSIVAHSLGSIITWDILANQKPDSFDDPHNIPTPPTSQYPSTSPEQHHYFTRVGVLASLFGTPTTPIFESQSKTHTEDENENDEIVPYPQLNFRVSNTFMLGSPIAVFLLLRGVPISNDYVLPGTERIFNIFHKYDPAAYRIEPLINRKNANVEPVILPTWKGGFRYQYQTKILWRRIMNTLWKTQRRFFQSVEAGMSKVGLLDEDESFEDEESRRVMNGNRNNGIDNDEDGDENENEDDEDDVSVTSNSNSDYTTDDEEFSSGSASESEDDGMGLGGGHSSRVDTGKLCGGFRIDYVLQEKEFENANEYIFALAAHSGYWSEKDLSVFIAREVLRDTEYYVGNTPLKKSFASAGAGHREHDHDHDDDSKESRHKESYRSKREAFHQQRHLHQLKHRRRHDHEGNQNQFGDEDENVVSPRSRYLHKKLEQISNEDEDNKKKISWVSRMNAK